MSFSRGSALLELLAATAIFAVISTAFLKMLPIDSINALRTATSEAVVKRTVELELLLAARSDRYGIAPPRIVSPSRIVSHQPNSVTSPMPYSNGLLYADFSGTQSAPIRINPDSIIGETVAVAGLGLSRAQTAIGCAPSRCVELRCRFERCSVVPDSKLLPVPAGVNPVPFIAVVYPASAVSVLYLSARNTLRRASVVGNEIVENQPVLDRIHSFTPSLEEPPPLLGAIVASAVISTSPAGPPITVSAIDSFVPSPLPLPLLKLGSR